ncbi:hypothetical protein [uncultured Friedmanniella sp.]|uniref:hypothetical protein n=1 Tax=uncultured Friedmanniella sp. TaxID=335381 RepID=UPI0035CA7B67
MNAAQEEPAEADEKLLDQEPPEVSDTHAEGVFGEDRAPHEALPRQPGEDMPQDLPPEGLRPDLARYLDESEVTPAGRAYYEPGDDRMVDAAAQVPPDEGSYTVDMHRDTDYVYIGSDQLSPDDLATMLEHDSRYEGGPIRLFACDTGQTADGFAQQLSNRMSVPVLAPTELAWSGPDGIFVTSASGVNIFGEPIPTEPHDGEWRLFMPDEGRKRR